MRLVHALDGTQIGQGTVGSELREAVAVGVVSIVHVNTKFNQADMGTKALNGPTHQFLLQNQNFPPVSTAGEWQPAIVDLSGGSTWKAQLGLMVCRHWTLT